MNLHTLTLKQQYQQAILNQYGSAVFIHPDELLELYKVYNSDHVKMVRQLIESCMTTGAKYPFVCYVLGASIVTNPNYCCAGIRYGLDGEYMSLPWLPATVWAP